MYFGFLACAAAAVNAGLKRSTCPTCRTRFFRRASADQRRGVGGVVGERFLDQKMHAGFEQLLGQIVMQSGGRCDDRGVDAADERR